MPSDARALARRIRFSSGYLALDMLREAAEELAQIAPEHDTDPDVVSARLDLHMAGKEWRRVVELGEGLARSTPAREQGWIAWAYALRELGHIAEAKRVLLEAEPRHGPTCGVLHYNLACYHCLLNEMPEAKRRLGIASRMDPQWKQAAFADPDLCALRAELESADDAFA